MARFTIRELKAMAYGPIAGRGIPESQKRGIKRYLKSPEGRARIARGRRIRKRHSASPYTLRWF